MILLYRFIIDNPQSIELAEELCIKPLTCLTLFVSDNTIKVLKDIKSYNVLNNMSIYNLNNHEAKFKQDPLVNATFGSNKEPLIPVVLAAYHGNGNINIRTICPY